MLVLRFSVRTWHKFFQAHNKVTEKVSTELFSKQQVPILCISAMSSTFECLAQPSDKALWILVN